VLPRGQMAIALILLFHGCFLSKTLAVKNVRAGLEAEPTSFYVPDCRTTITSFVEAVSTALGMTQTLKKLPALLPFGAISVVSGTATN